MKVTANKRGYFVKLREAGDVFEVPDGLKASWFEPVEEPKKGRQKAEKPEAEQE